VRVEIIKLNEIYLTILSSNQYIDMAPNLTAEKTTSSHGDESYSGRKDQKPKENGIVRGGGNQQNGS
jgi:hypothetical protein